MKEATVVRLAGVGLKEADGAPVTMLIMGRTVGIDDMYGLVEEKLRLNISVVVVVTTSGLRVVGAVKSFRGMAGLASTRRSLELVLALRTEDGLTGFMAPMALMTSWA